MANQTQGHASLLNATLGGYEVRALIGRGAMGTVYLAHDTALNRQVALKVLLGSLARNPAMVRSFHLEAQAAAPLKHPNIVRIYSAGIEAGTPFIAMEYVPGEPLDRFLRRKVRIPWEAALFIGGQVAEALKCAHEAGIVHRDVKPANILLDRQGRVRLTDFGIARLTNQDAAQQDGARTFGTPYYMSPERCEGAEPTISADLYSLGVTIFQLIAGRLPFHSESTPALMKQILTDEAPRLNRLRDDVPDDVARLVAMLLEKQPERRPASARQVVQQVERLLSEGGGRSAIPEALASFVREQAANHNLRLMTPPPKTKKTTPVTVRPTVRGRAYKRLAFSFGTALLALIAAWTGLGLVRTAGAQSPPAPVLEAFVMSNLNDAVVGRLPNAGFAFERLTWTPDSSALLIEVEGRNDTLARDTRGILAIDPLAHRCWSLCAPMLSTASGGYPKPAHLTPAAEQSSEHSPLAGTILYCERIAAESGTKLLAQGWNEAAPTPIAYLAFTTSDSDEILQVAPSPNGRTLCLVAQEGGETHLYESSVNGGSIAKPGARLTEGANPIDPKSVRYSADGSRLLYMRTLPGDRRELWALDPKEGAVNGVPLAIGPLDTGYAISPDGAYVAVATRVMDEEEPDLRIINIATTEIEARLGPGTVGPGSWHPNGSTLAVTATDDSGVAQLWMVDRSGMTQRRMIETTPTGVESGVSISPDGRLAAAVVAKSPQPTVIVVPIDDSKTLAAAGSTESEGQFHA